ncbi:MAG: hypothetical protein AAB575_03615 [Patescibacteria group bacterium]
MSNRTKIILIIVVGLLVIAGILIFFLYFDNSSPAPKDETAPVAKIDAEPAETKIIVAPLAPQEKTASSLKAVSVTFTERFGSYSNQSEYLNLTELLPLVTDKMYAWINESYIPKLKKDYASGGFYYEISTSAPVSNIITQTDTTAKIKVSTQRREQKADQAPTEFLQDLILDIVKVNNSWLVDSAYWQPKK